MRKFKGKPAFGAHLPRLVELQHYNEIVNQSMAYWHDYNNDYVIEFYSLSFQNSQMYSCIK